jgi:cytochrome c-type biogenesis protein CcmH
MLANSYAVLNRFPQASKAFARARALAPDDAQLLADHADVLAMLQNQSVEGEPGRLVMRALQIDPRNLKALTMAGSWAFERRDYAGAINYWTQAQPMAPPGSDFAAGLANSLQSRCGARAQLAAAAARSDKVAQGAGSRRRKKPVPAGASAHVSGRVRRRSCPNGPPGDTLLCLHGPSTGRACRWPSSGKSVRLPLTFTLMTAAPWRRSSARIQAGHRRCAHLQRRSTPRSGDLTGRSDRSMGAGKLVLMIDSVTLRPER